MPPPPVPGKQSRSTTARVDSDKKACPVRMAPESAEVHPITSEKYQNTVYTDQFLDEAEGDFEAGILLQEAFADELANDAAHPPRQRPRRAPGLRRHRAPREGPEPREGPAPGEEGEGPGRTTNAHAGGNPRDPGRTTTSDAGGNPRATTAPGAAKPGRTTNDKAGGNPRGRPRRRKSSKSSGRPGRALPESGVVTVFFPVVWSAGPGVANGRHYLAPEPGVVWE